MGYRTHIGIISKKEYNEIKSFNQEQLNSYKGNKDKDDYIGAWEIAPSLYEFGKYTEFDDEKFYKPFWDNEEFQEYYEGDFWVVEKEFLKHIIEHYKNKVLSYYENLLTADGIQEEYGRFKKITEDGIRNLSFEKKVEWFDHIKNIWSEWKNDFAIDMTHREKITGSWKYEYSLFELARIYKTFDWENNIMVYYGY